MKNLWRYWIHLFIATKKVHYALLSIRFLWILESLHPRLRELFEKYSIFSFSGDEGSGIAPDGMIELVSVNNRNINLIGIFISAFDCNRPAIDRDRRAFNQSSAPYNTFIAYVSNAGQLRVDRGRSHAKCFQIN